MWVVPASGDTTLSRGCEYTAPVASQSLGWRVSTKTCDSESFPSVKKGTYYVPHYRLKGAQKALKLSVKRGTSTYSTDHIIESDKYVQAVGLFIFGFSQAKKTVSPTWK